MHFKKTDWAWFLAAPLYLAIGTIRHEGAHAVVGVLEGAKLEEFVFLPSVIDGVFRFGYVTLSGRTTWLMSAAPYLLDVIIALLCFVLLVFVSMPHWLRINMLIVGPVTSFIN